MERVIWSWDGMLSGCTRLCACFLFLGLLLEPALAELRIDVPYGNAQGWKIGYSSSLKGCLAQGVYDGDTTIWWGFTENKGGNKSAYIALANPKWRALEKDKTYELVLRMRGQGNWRGKFFGIETNEGMGFVSEGLAKKFVIAFAEAGGVEFYVGRSRLVSLHLSGSRSAVGSVLDCERDSGQVVAADSKKSEKHSNETSTGTGIVVSSTGHIITNNHVVENCSQIEVSQAGQAPVPARKAASDARMDLALLKSDLTNVRVPSFRASARLGEEVFVFGFPLAGLLSKSGNFTSGAITALSGLDEDSTRFQISAPVQPGNSGGPLLDKYGNIAGVVVSKLNSAGVAQVTGDIPQNVNFAIKPSIAVSFLESNNIRVSTGVTGKVLDSADVAELATQYAVYIECKSGPASTAQSKIPDRAGQASLDKVSPAAQRVVLYDEDPSDPKGKQYVGSVIWRTEPVKASGNQTAGIAVRGDVNIPDRKYKMTISFRRNTDMSLPASHTAELTFILPKDFGGGGVGNVPGILMKSNEQARGTPLAGLAVKVTDGFFLVGLSNVASDRSRNLQLIKERSWFDVPLVYANQRRAIVAIEKGAPGERAFNEAFASWGE